MNYRNILITILLLVVVGNVAAQDTVYVMRGGVVKQKLLLKDIDSVSFVNTLDMRKSVVEKISRDSRFTLFYKALRVTGLVDSLQMDKDRTYFLSKELSLSLVNKSLSNWYYELLPNSRKYGFTIFMESNEVFSKLNIQNLDDLKGYAKSVYDAVYPQDAGIVDVADRRNSLNRFIAYHIIAKKMTASMLIDAYDTDHMLKTVDMYEYLETMCPNTLMEVSKIRSTGKSNQINRLNDAGSVVQIVKSSENDIQSNGIFHEVDRILTYSKDVQDYLSQKRLRFDFASIFPELTNNNFRGVGLTDPNCQIILPRGYLNRIACSEKTTIKYLSPYKKIQDFEGNELSISSSKNSSYDFTITLPAVPAGSYEVRIGCLINGRSGVIDAFFDGKAISKPINMNIFPSSNKIGWVYDGNKSADPFGFENDKVLRNHGYMKGPACYKVPITGWSNGDNARNCEQIIRKILGTYLFSSSTNHTLSIKGYTTGSFQLDYIEFIPTSLIETEDIY